MNTLIIYAHPYEKSFNHAIFEKVKQDLTKKHKDFDVIDLYKDCFNPVYTTEELALFKDGKTTDKLVSQYQEKAKYNVK